MAKRFLQIPPLRILLICTLIGFIAGAMGFFINFYATFERDPARVIAELDADVTEIVSIVSPSLGMTVPVMRTTDGDLIAHGYLEFVHLYERQPQVHEPCSADNLAAIEAEAGPLMDCKQGAAITEYCPSSIRAYAITEEGELWLVLQDRPCAFVAVGYGVMAAVVGFLVACEALLVHWVLLAVQKRM